MSNHLTVTVPVEGKEGKASFRRVGVAFKNREGSKAAMKIVMDFPVAATEFVLFEGKPRDSADGDLTE